ncbi:hypothetical protein FNJ84_01750 [Paracoccus sp. M683]|uniref:hypothetical protein n=1 Tax=Paracoccus sp. M683 TaxID=2594268 RepID=UPI0011805847|nr:hypothetical protein [Paracoccus sp. M683]TRW99423.1 hypothetical protein FNJ84_01750 [Paracoccus sp. M683]
MSRLPLVAAGGLLLAAGMGFFGLALPANAASGEVTAQFVLENNHQVNTTLNQFSESTTPIDTENPTSLCDAPISGFSKPARLWVRR